MAAPSSVTSLLKNLTQLVWRTVNLKPKRISFAVALFSGKEEERGKPHMRARSARQDKAVAAFSEQGDDEDARTGPRYRVRKFDCGRRNVNKRITRRAFLFLTFYQRTVCRDVIVASVVVVAVGSGKGRRSRDSFLNGEVSGRRHVRSPFGWEIYKQFPVSYSCKSAVFDYRAVL